VSLVVEAASDSVVTVELFASTRGQVYLPETLLASDSRDVRAGGPNRVEFELGCRVDEPSNVLVVIRRCDGVRILIVPNEIPGVLALKRVELEGEQEWPQPVLEWSPKALHGRMPALSVTQESDALEPARVVDGLQRNFGGPHMWSSDHRVEHECHWLQLDWQTEVEFSRIELVFDDDVNEDLINLHYMRTPGREMPTLVRDYTLETQPFGSDDWNEIVEVRDNRRRFRVHPLPDVVSAAKLRIRIASTNGARTARIIGVRVF